MPNVDGSGGTTPTQIRLTDEDKAKIEAIRARYGLPSRASAIRYAVETVYLALSPPAPGAAGTPRKKSEKKGEVAP